MKIRDYRCFATKFMGHMLVRHGAINYQLHMNLVANYQIPSKISGQGCIFGFGSIPRGSIDERERENRESKLMQLQVTAA